MANDTHPVYDWILTDGTGFGCGTQVEFDYWSAQGVNPEGARLGAVICHEPAYMDDNRTALWGMD